MNPRDALALRDVYAQVARVFQFEADKIVRRKAPRDLLLQLFGPYQSKLGWSDDDVFDTIINLRKAKKLPSLHELLATKN